VIELPLRAVRMKRVWDLSGGDAQDFHVEAMALVQVGGPRIASECLGDSLAEPSKFSLRDSDDSSAMLRVLTFIMTGTRVFTL
jgi:hypothetical protein